MTIWYRSALLAGGAILAAGIHVGAQIREGGGQPARARARAGLAERPNHPTVLLNTRDGEFLGDERVVTQVMLKQLDPRTAVGKLTPPKGIDGLIAYPASRMLTVRGTKSAVATYRAALEKLDQEPHDSPVAKASPQIVVPATAKLDLRADQVTRDGDRIRASGHVVIRLGGGAELRAEQVEVTTEKGAQRIAIQR